MATCFDLVGHPHALQESSSKSCLVYLHCGIPNANTFASVTETCWHLGYHNAEKTKQLLDLFSWRV